MKLIAAFIIILFFLSCKKVKDGNNCTDAVLVFSTTVSASDACIAQGSISITTAANYLYRLNNVGFENNVVFSNLLPGKYAITAKNSIGCIKTDSVSVPAKNAGVLFIQTKNILAVYCTSCHSGINPQAGLNWTDNCSIVNQQSRIKARAIDGNPATMPPTGLIPIAERNKIMQWLNTGGRYTD